jgi:two-component system, sensor histidine kinase ChiS
MKVLLTEDDAASRIVLQKHLQNWGYEVIAAEDGNKAWEIIQTCRPQIVLVDWIMPGMDGLQLCKKIRGQSENNYIYTIFLTSKTENEDMVTALDTGADDFLSKPFDKNVLRGKMAAGARIINYENEMRIARQKAEDAQAKLEKLNLQLELTYKKLMEAAHVAGMAEVAANVLHNVGNALNSINVSANLISEKLSKSEILNLQKLSDLLKNHTDNLADFLTNDPQGKFVPTYLTEASNHLVQQKNEILGSLRSLIKNVEHVKDIVHMQQLYTAVGRQQDCVSLPELIENAIDINKAGLERIKIEVVREYEDFGNILIDKHRIIQILVCLIDNAEHALAESQNEPKLLKIRVTKSDSQKVRIEIADNGIGINPQDMDKIFSNGFTTKPAGHGFGLHGCRLAAKDMQGTITVSSPGKNQGATFIIELPLIKAEVKNGKHN